jgi:hypothetical protein
MGEIFAIVVAAVVALFFGWIGGVNWPWHI